MTWLEYALETTGNVRLSAILLIATAVITGIALHYATLALLRGVMIVDAHGRAILARVRGLTRLAAVVLSLIVILPALDIDPSVAEGVRRVLKIGMVVLLGWSATLAIKVSANWMERNHPIDVEDNLAARRIRTQIDILRRVALVIVLIVTVGGILVTFPSVQTYGVSLFASAGVGALVIGLAARPVLANIIAGIQIALTQPIRIDDVVIVEGEWGWIEEITPTYVVIRVWDLRRLIVPLSHFIEKPFQNWTRESAAIIGEVLWHLDYRAPVSAMRTKLRELVETHPLWDRKTVNLQVVECGPTTITVRGLVSARSSPSAWDLRCHVREAMLTWLREEHPEALPRLRAGLEVARDIKDRPWRPSIAAP